MHPSVMDFVRASALDQEIRGRKIIEVGSLDVNGSPRGLITALRPEIYIGVDCCLGPCVDVVCKADDLVKTFGEESFDVLISTEMLEHVEDWRAIINQLKRVVKKEGLFILTTRSPGFPYHPYPIDKWRYTKDDFRAIFKDLEILELKDDHLAAGVFLKARKPKDYVEADLTGIEVHVV